MLAKLVLVGKQSLSQIFVTAATAPVTGSIVAFRLTGPFPIQGTRGEAAALTVDEEPRPHTLCSQFVVDFVTDSGRGVDAYNLVTITAALHHCHRAGGAACVHISIIRFHARIESGIGFCHRGQCQGTHRGIVFAADISALGCTVLRCHVKGQGQFVLDSRLSHQFQVQALETCLDNDTRLVQITDRGAEITGLITSLDTYVIVLR